MFLRGVSFEPVIFASSNLFKELINDVHKGLALKMSIMKLFPIVKKK